MESAPCQNMVLSLLALFEEWLTLAGIQLPDSPSPKAKANPIYSGQHIDVYDYLKETVKEKLGETVAPIRAECFRQCDEALQKQELLAWLNTMSTMLEKAVQEWETTRTACEFYVAFLDAIPRTSHCSFMSVSLDGIAQIKDLIRTFITAPLNAYVGGIRNYCEKDYFHIRFLKAYVRCMGEGLQEIEDLACGIILESKETR